MATNKPILLATDRELHLLADWAKGEALNHYMARTGSGIAGALVAFSAPMGDLFNAPRPQAVA